MKSVFPPPIVKGEEIRIIAPSAFLSPQDPKVIRAKGRLESLGFIVTFGENYKHRKSPDKFDSSPVSERIEDMHSAFLDPKVKAIIPVCGGFNAIQLPDKLNYEIIYNNPKIFCGFSDNTVLINAIFFKTGLVTFHAPNLFYFGYESEVLSKVLIDCFFDAFHNKNIDISSTGNWIDYSGNLEKPQNATFPNIINQGFAQGLAVGGNLSSFVLLNGTAFQPPASDLILFLEDDYIYQDKATFYFEFERKLRSLMLQNSQKNIKGLLIGKFEQISGITVRDIHTLIKNNPMFDHIPVIANLDIGHTYPFRTLPVGKTLLINAQNNNIYVE